MNEATQAACLRSKTMSRLLLMLRWIGAFVVANIVFYAVIAVGIVAIHPDPNVDNDVFFSVVAMLQFLATVLAVTLGALVVPREQRKAAALVLWIGAVAYSVWPLLKGHLGTNNFLLFSDGVVSGGVAYYLARTSLISGRKINRISDHSSQKGQPRNQEAGGDGRRAVPVRSKER
jgi:hypothetical protein